jgi:hypothetical protein
MKIVLADESTALPSCNKRDKAIIERLNIRPEALAIRLGRAVEVVETPVSPFDEYAWRVCPSKVCVEGE